jgi:hypothetical protein
MSTIYDWIDEGGYSVAEEETEQARITKARYDAIMCNNKHLTCIIAGGRDIHDYELLKEAIQECQFPIATVVSGGAKGVDALGEKYAEENGLNLKIFNADWESHGRAAGPIRNRKMAENADALIAIWDGKSRGTKNMIETATKLGLLVYVKRV